MTVMMHMALDVAIVAAFWWAAQGTGIAALLPKGITDQV